MANSREFNPNHPIPLCVIDATQQTELATRRSHPFDETYYTLSIMRARPAERAEECTNRSSARGGRCYHRTVLDRCFLADAHDSKKVTLGQTTTPPIGFHRKKHAVYLSTDGLGDDGRQRQVRGLRHALDRSRERCREEHYHCCWVCSVRTLILQLSVHSSGHVGVAARRSRVPLIQAVD